MAGRIGCAPVIAAIWAIHGSSKKSGARASAFVCAGGALYGSPSPPIPIPSCSRRSSSATRSSSRSAGCAGSRPSGSGCSWGSCPSRCSITPVVTYAQADYWASYRLTFLFSERIVVVPANPSEDRYAPYRRAFEAAPVYAYVFDANRSREDLGEVERRLDEESAAVERTRIGRHTVLSSRVARLPATSLERRSDGHRTSGPTLERSPLQRKLGQEPHRSDAGSAPGRHRFLFTLPRARLRREPQSVQGTLAYGSTLESRGATATWRRDSLLERCAFDARMRGSLVSRRSRPRATGS